MTRKNRPFIITTGDIDGVGLEVTIKALNSIFRSSKNSYVIIRSFNKQRCDSLIQFKYSVHTDLESAIQFSNNSEDTKIHFVLSSESPAFWVESAAILALKKIVQGMITAPLSKTEIRSSGLKDIGHTGILSRISGVKEPLKMAFLGNFFHLVLNTDHIPLNKVSRSINEKSLSRSIYLAQKLIRMIGGKSDIRVLGLNPHAGDGGLIGNEDQKIKRFLTTVRGYPNTVSGPYVPDAVFNRFSEQLQRSKKSKPNRSRTNQQVVFIAQYHDQGLIPFKIIHGYDNGTHLTLGLPFIRTSVDHGTAKDIFGKNIANPNSMIDAINWCDKLTSR